MAEQPTTQNVLSSQHASAQSRTRQTSHPATSQYPTPGDLQQYYMQVHYQQQQHAQQQQQLQSQPLQNKEQRRHVQSRRQMTRHTSPTQPLMINTGQTQQSRPRQSSVPSHAYPSLTAQHLVQLPTPQEAQPSTPSSEQILRNQVVSLLASTANGCIVELGYPALLKKYQNLSADYDRLNEACRGLKEQYDSVKHDNFRMAQLLTTKQEEVKKKEQQDAQIFQTLNARIAQLEKEQDLLRRQCRVLQQSRTLDAPQAYKVLEDKYHYVLEMLKNFNVPITIQNPNGDGEIHLINAETVVNGRPIGNDAHPQDMIDLTVSRGGSPDLNSTNQATAPTGVISQPVANNPQFLEGSSSRPLPASSSAPLISDQQDPIIPSSEGTQKHSRRASVPGPTSARLSAPPTVQAFPKPVSSSANGSDTGPPTAGQQHVRPATAHATVGGHIQPATAAGAFTPTFVQPTQMQMQPQPQPHTVSPPIYVPAPVPAKNRMLTSTVAQTRIVSQGASAAPLLYGAIATHAGPSARPTSQASATIIASAEEDRPQLQVHTAFGRQVHHTPPTPLSPLSSQIAKAAGIPSRCSSPVAPVSEATNNQTALREVRSPSRERSPNSALSPPSVVTPKDVQAMDVDGNEKVRGRIEAEDQDIVTAGGEVSGVREVPICDTLDDNLVPQHAVGGEEEEEEEVYDDLTDDEDGRKQPVFDCVSSIFYDDENDERFCTFCNARLEKLNLLDPRPTFTHCSIRELIMHGKNEHAFVWEKLRRAVSKA